MTYVTSDSISLKVEASGSIIMAWVDGALENSTNADGIIDDFVISDAFDAATGGIHLRRRTRPMRKREGRPDRRRTTRCVILASVSNRSRVEVELEISLW